MSVRHLAAAVVLLGAIGCGGAGRTPETPSLAFGGPPALTVASESGQLTLALWWSPVQPTVGYDAAQIVVTDLAGAALSGATLTVVPWMAAHGHGASVQPTVSETAPGVYVAVPLDLYMSGSWQLRTRIQRDAGDGGSAIDDTAAPSLDVP
jgi:hypothetical protein